MFIDDYIIDKKKISFDFLKTFRNPKLTKYAKYFKWWIER